MGKVSQKKQPSHNFMKDLQELSPKEKFYIFNGVAGDFAPSGQALYTFIGWGEEYSYWDAVEDVSRENLTDLDKSLLNKEISSLLLKTNDEMNRLMMIAYRDGGIGRNMPITVVTNDREYVNQNNFDRWEEVDSPEKALLEMANHRND